MKIKFGIIIFLVGVLTGGVIIKLFFQPRLPDNLNRSLGAFKQSNLYHNNLQNIFAIRVKHVADSLTQNGHTEFQHISDSIDIIRNMTAQMVDFIDKTDSTLLRLKGMMNKYTGEFQNLDELDKNRSYFMGNNPKENGGRGNGAANILYDSLYRYSQKLGTFVNRNLPDSLQVWIPFVITQGVTSIDELAFTGPAIANRFMLITLKERIYSFEEKILFTYALRLKMVRTRIPVRSKDEGRDACIRVRRYYSYENYYYF